MVAVDDATPTLGAASACRVLGLPRASLYRGRRPVAVARSRPAPPRALDPIERQGILDLLHTRFIDLGLIRSRGHVPKGGYDVPNGSNHTSAVTPAIQ